MHDFKDTSTKTVSNGTTATNGRVNLPDLLPIHAELSAIDDDPRDVILTLPIGDGNGYVQVQTENCNRTEAIATLRRYLRAFGEVGMDFFEITDPHIYGKTPDIDEAISESGSEKTPAPTHPNRVRYNEKAIQQAVEMAKRGFTILQIAQRKFERTDGTFAKTERKVISKWLKNAGVTAGPL